MKRKIPIRTGSTHHVYSKSINDFKIFRSSVEYKRFREILCYYQYVRPLPFAWAVKSAKPAAPSSALTARVQILSYCIMPTHFHLILRQETERGIERFVSDICNSYTRFFNLRHNRKGPLWQNRFGNSLIETEAELRRVKEYVRKNPVKAKLVRAPQDWPYSSAASPTPEVGEVD